MIDCGAQIVFVCYLPVGREERVFGVCQMMLLQKLPAEDRLVDRFSREPLRPPVKPRDFLLWHFAPSPRMPFPVLVHALPAPADSVELRHTPSGFVSWKFRFCFLFLQM